ncbi:MAG: carboxypeptidase regulatory-like domain-containing protein [Nitrospirae bacterium]|nr:carboxypeptidase regulatory-like domain-containing protein [Nitrospirota bacterium]
MSFANPAYIVPRQDVVGMEGMHSKMFDPPTESPATPDPLTPTNPVPEVMAAAGHQDFPSTPHTVQRDLLHGMTMLTWDGQKNMTFFTFRDKDNPATGDGNYPAATIRVPRGVIFHGETSAQGPPPHTIHWHGIEPTPMNDGVGHCSMELGHYTYQWQPNFIGTYFCHCHRNTMQHFEFGLFGLLLIEPPDAYFSSIGSTNPDGSVNLNNIPIGHCRDGKRRTAAGLAGFPQFPGFNANPLDTPDPLGQYTTDPHAHTVPYDVEALWVLDDRDSVWSDMAPNAKATFPKHAHIDFADPLNSSETPGVDDKFHENPGVNGFFAFNDFNADYWYITGVPVPGHKGETAAIPAGIVIPPELNSGVTGTQISIEAKVGQTILIRCLDAAYNCTTITFPVDVVIIAWDGRALGVPPYGYNEAYMVPANTPIHTSTARRFDALIRTTQPMSSFATVEFINTRGQVPGFPEDVLMTAKIPINVAGGFAISGTVKEQSGLAIPGAIMSVTGPVNQTSVADSSGNYNISGLVDGNYTVTPSLAGYTFTPPSCGITITNADAAGCDFIGTQAAATFAISGRITDQTGAALADAVITLSGPVNGTAVSDAAGNYILSGLTDGVYTATPSLTGYTFAPTAGNVTVSGADVTGQNFSGTLTPVVFTISGRAVERTGDPSIGTTLTLIGPVNRTTSVDTTGFYSFAGLPNGNYEIIPSLAGCRFSPLSRDVTINNRDVSGQDFVCTRTSFAISGTVTDRLGAPLSGVTISVYGTATKTAVTDAAGFYSVAGLSPGDYEVMPSRSGYRFSPLSRDVSVRNADITGRNFRGVSRTR